MKKNLWLTSLLIPLALLAAEKRAFQIAAAGKELCLALQPDPNYHETTDKDLWIPSPTGKLIHTFVVKPHGFDPSKKYPLIINIHGGPQIQWADAFRADWQVYPGAGYVVAFPNPHGSTGYGQEFTLAISKDWAGKVYQDVMAVTDSLARLSYVDPAPWDVQKTVRNQIFKQE
jgi:prolyl oligopeptidase PreP (S9A serine peptidase family)